MNKISKLCTVGKIPVNTGFLEKWITGCSQNKKEFSTLYPQNVENLRKLKNKVEDVDSNF